MEQDIMSNQIQQEIDFIVAADQQTTQPQDLEVLDQNFYMGNNADQKK